MILLPLLLACTGSDQGTVVGNPGDAYARLAPADGDVTVTSAMLEVEELVLVACDGDQREVELGEDEVVDLLGAGFLGQLPGGSWCELRLDEVEELSLAGTSSGGDWQLDADIEGLALQALDVDFVIDGGSFVLELAEPGWLADSPATFQSTVTDRSALFLDLDEDGEVDDAEREQAAVAAGADREQDLEPAGADTADGANDDDDDDDDDCEDCDDDDGGCGGNAAVLLLSPLLFGRRRRSRGTPEPRRQN